MKKSRESEVKITHFSCQKFSDVFAYGAVKFLRFLADVFLPKDMFTEQLS